MGNNQNQSKKVFLGVLLGGVIGAAALYMVRGTHNRKQPFIKRIGKTISDVGGMLENCTFGGSEIANKVEKALPSGMEVVDNIVDLIDIGMKILKKFK